MDTPHQPIIHTRPHGPPHQPIIHTPPHGHPPPSTTWTPITIPLFTIVHMDTPRHPIIHHGHPHHVGEPSSTLDNSTSEVDTQTKHREKQRLDEEHNLQSSRTNNDKSFTPSIAGRSWITSTSRWRAIVHTKQLYPRSRHAKRAQQRR